MNLDEARVAEHKARTAASLDLVVPASTFGSTAFWRRMKQFSAERGHAEHPARSVAPRKVNQADSPDPTTVNATNPHPKPKPITEVISHHPGNGTDSERRS